VIKAEKPKDSAYPTIIETLGDRIRAKRLDLRLRQKDIAMYLGVDETSIWNWENNRAKPLLKFTIRITAFLE